jgi:UDP-GlcNAc:undecaprenyl-phosphate/decaprenyl-phosphate GlcNAc-1-phosphate transferase
VNGWMAYLLLVVFFVWGKFLFPSGLSFLTQHGIAARNYQGKAVPASMGVCLMWGLFTGWVLLLLLLGNHHPTYPVLLVMLVSSLTVCLLGWMDDTIGSKTAKGWKGHWRSWKQGAWTTGAMKAWGGGMAAALAAAATSSGMFEWLMDTLMIAMMTNWLNLLDLRPGRSLKFFLLFGLALLLTAPYEAWLFTPLMGLVLAYWPLDLAGKAMLGDSGSNLLGIQLGMWLALATSTGTALILVVLLLGGHIFAEKRSITAWIERNRWMAYLDALGRKQS